MLHNPTSADRDLVSKFLRWARHLPPSKCQVDRAAGQECVFQAEPCDAVPGNGKQSDARTAGCKLVQVCSVISELLRKGQLLS